MNKKLFIYSFFSVLVLSTFLAAPIFAAEPVVTWKVFSPFFVGTWENKTVEAWIDDISKMSGGRMKIDLYAAVAACKCQRGSEMGPSGSKCAYDRVWFYDIRSNEY